LIHGQEKKSSPFQAGVDLRSIQELLGHKFSTE